MQVIMHDFFLKEMLGYMSEYHIKFLHTCLVIFLPVIFAKTEFFEVPYHRLNGYNWFPFFAYVQNKLYALTMPHVLFSLGGT